MVNAIFLPVTAIPEVINLELPVRRGIFSGNPPGGEIGTDRQFWMDAFRYCEGMWAQLPKQSEGLSACYQPLPNCSANQEAGGSS